MNVNSRKIGFKGPQVITEELNGKHILLNLHKMNTELPDIILNNLFPEATETNFRESLNRAKHVWTLCSIVLTKKKEFVVSITIEFH